MDDITARIFDCIVVGSGPAGVICAQTLVEAGKNVLLLDTGAHAEGDEAEFTGGFTDIRKNSTEQESLFLGDTMEQLDFEYDREFGQMTPQRRYVVENVNNISKVLSNEFALLESFATGGLGNAWGLGCFTFSDAELLKAKLDPQQIRRAYDVIAQRIGIAYTADDIMPYAADGLSSLQPAINIDDNAKAIIERYRRKRKQINRQAFYLGVPPLALLTQNKGERKATDYSNMDFYGNSGMSAYRPSITITQLRMFRNFIHLRGIAVTNFVDGEIFVQVSGTDLKSLQKIQFKTKKLVLACNVMGTARIVARSMELYGKNIPLLSNHYSILTTLQWRQLGKVPADHKTSTAQLCLFHDTHGNQSDVPMASLYSYSSLMLFRLLKQSPFNYRDSLRIFQYLHPALLIAGIHHPTSPDDVRYARLQQNNTLAIAGSDTPEHAKRTKATEKQFARVLKKLGCMPFKKINPPQGSSAHYAGTLPFSDDQAPLSLSPEGLVAGTRNVYAADASGFCYLPAKGPTLTIMANAHNVAVNILRHE